MWMKEEFTWRTEYQYGGHQPKFVLLPITVMAFSTTIPKLTFWFSHWFLPSLSFGNVICIHMYRYVSPCIHAWSQRLYFKNFKSIVLVFTWACWAEFCHHSFHKYTGSVGEKQKMKIERRRKTFFFLFIEVKKLSRYWKVLNINSVKYRGKYQIIL